MLPCLVEFAMSQPHLLHSINIFPSLTILGFIVFILPGLGVPWLSGALLLSIGLLYGGWLWAYHRKLERAKLYAPPKYSCPYRHHGLTPKRFEEAELAYRVQWLEAKARENDKVKLLKNRLLREQAQQQKRLKALANCQRQVAKTISEI